MMEGQRGPSDDKLRSVAVEIMGSAPTEPPPAMERPMCACGLAHAEDPGRPYCASCTTHHEQTGAFDGHRRLRYRMGGSLPALDTMALATGELERSDVAKAEGPRLSRAARRAQRHRGSQ